jgi:multiple sugar transport system permease protein
MAQALSVAGVGRRPRRRGSGLARQRARWGLFFAFPLIIGLVVFTYGPVIAGLGLSFTEYSTTAAPKWVGLANFRYIVNWDLAKYALRNVAYYTAGSLVIGVPLAIVLAIALNQKIRGVVAYRSIYFLPSITAGVGVLMLWQYLYSTDFGLLNFVLGLVGIPRVPWLTNQYWAMPAMIIMNVWGSVGFRAFLFLAALQGVPQEYYEAALIDGASAWRRFTGITLPLISPTTFFVIVTGAIGGFQVFNEMYVMTKGGPNYATLPVVLLIYQEGFQGLRFGRASALALILFAFVLVLSIVQFRFQNRWVYYEA